MVGSVSCDSEATETIPSSVASSDAASLVTPATLERKNLALLLTSLPMTGESYQEVFDAVSVANDNGLEEAYYFSEILTDTPEENKIATLRSASLKGKGLGQLIKETLSKEAELRSGGIGAGAVLDADKIANSNLQIYWPYAEDWDGSTPPVITFAPEDEDQDWNYAYKRNGERIDTIIVDEEYMMNNPVWIVNTSDRKYEDLPAFSKGENVANNTLYVQRKSTPAVKETRNGVSVPVYTVRLGRFMSSKQYDKVWSGGSEFVVQMGYIEHFKLENAENLSSLDPRITHAKVSRSRKDIRKRRWADLNSLLISDWHPKSSEAAFMIHEEDQGGNDHFEITVTAKVGPVSISAPIKIPHKSGDDLVYKNVISRNFILSTNNKQGDKWVEHNGSGVHWTFPYQIGYTID